MRLRSTWILLTILLLLAWPGQLSFGLPDPGDPWIRVSTDHFELIGNAPGERILEAGENLERLRSEFDRIVSHTATDPTVSTRIFVFRDDASFGPYKPGPDGRPLAQAGFSLAADDGNFIAIDASAGTEALQVIQHEYLHFYVSDNALRLPVWLEEGLAEYYSTYRVSGNNIESGRQIDHHRSVLKKGPVLSLEELFEIDRASPLYDEVQRRGIFYAESWALIHFLLADETPRVAALVRGLQDGLKSRAALEKAYGKPLPDMEAQFAKYLRGGKYRGRTAAVEAASASVEVGKMSRPDLLSALAGLLLHQLPQGAAQAESHAQAALALDENHPTALATGSRLLHLRGRLVEADGSYARAIELNPDDAGLLEAHGLLLFDRYLDEKGTDPAAATKILERTRTRFRAALKIEPDRVTSLAGLGKSLLNDATGREESVRSLTRAAQLQPDRPGLQMYLILALAQAGDVEQARRRLDDGLRPLGDAKRTARAENSIDRAEIRRAVEIGNQGKTEESLTLLRGIRDRTSDPATTRTIDDLMGKVAAFGGNTRGVENYNRALELVDQERGSEAKGMLQEVVATATDEKLKRNAQSLLQEVLWEERLAQAVKLYVGKDLEGAAEILREILDQGLQGERGEEARRLLQTIEETLRFRNS